MAGDMAGMPAVPTWRWESPSPQGNNLRAVWGIAGKTADQDELYAGGENGTMLIGGSTGWKLQTRQTLDRRAILGLSGQGSGATVQVMAVGIYDLALQKSGTQAFADLNPVIGTGDGSLTSVWATPTPGEYFVVGTAGRIYRVRNSGVTWNQEAMGLTPDTLFGVSGSSTDVYAVGANGRIMHRVGMSWSIEANNMVSQSLNSVWLGTGTTAGEVFAAGDGGTIVHKQGGSWSIERPPTSAQLTAIWGAGDDVYAVGANGTIIHRRGGMWQAESQGLTGELLSAMWGTERDGQHTVYAVGNLGTILRRDQGTWTQLSSRVTTSSLSAVWARSSSEVYAVGADGLILRRAGTTDKGSWINVGSSLTPSSLNAISGWAPSVTGEAEVYAVGNDGAIVRKTLGGTWEIDGSFLTTSELLGVWASSGSVYVVGRGGRMYKKTQGSWGIELGPMGTPVTSDLYSVWGSGSGNTEVVYVVGANGTILRRDKVGWTQEASGITTETLVSLFGTSEDNLYAFGNKGSTFKRSGGKWAQTTVRTLAGGSSGIAGCVIPGTSDLLAIGTQGSIMRRTVTDWQPETSLTAQPFAGVAAAAANDFYIVGAGGLVLHKY